ncbi:hypothetical protein [Streptomyces enissocaesilis]|uniref:hypothetical protein n=1 Tax=Streptomyces enissocaesilis TaxID=332589 RepID=UPI0031CE159E
MQETTRPGNPAASIAGLLGARRNTICEYVQRREAAGASSWKPRLFSGLPDLLRRRSSPLVELERSGMSLGRLMAEAAPYDRYRGHVHRSERRTNAGHRAPAGCRIGGPVNPLLPCRGPVHLPPLLKILGDEENRRPVCPSGLHPRGHRFLRGIRGREFVVGVTTLREVQEHPPALFG